jgi:Rod binding domain-containing protein
MSQPVAPGGPSFPPSPLRKMDWGDNALTAPITPSNRLPVVDRTKVDPQIRKAAEGMEAMFLDYMMKSMRQTVQKSEMSLENPGTRMYQGMLDSEMAQQAARLGGVGLADQLIAYLQTERYNLANTGEVRDAAPNQAQQAEASTGGTR